MDGDWREKHKHLPIHRSRYNSYKTHNEESILTKKGCPAKKNPDKEAQRNRIGNRTTLNLD